MSRITPPAATGAQLAFGSELGVTQITSNATITTSQADVTGMAVTVTVPTGVGVYIEVEFPFIGSNHNAATTLGVYIYEGTTKLQSWFHTNFEVGGFRPVRVSRSLAATAGAHTYKVQAVCGGGTFTAYAGPGASETDPFIRVTAR